MAPERVLGKIKVYNLESCKKADLWSVGIIMFLLFIGELPFEGNSCQEVIEKMK